MGKVFVGQIGAEFEATCSTNIAGATELLIKYIKPSTETGQWVASEVDDINGIMNFVTTLVTDLDEDGKWILWSHVIFSDGSVMAGEPFEYEIYNEGQIC